MRTTFHQTAIRLLAIAVAVLGAGVGVGRSATVEEVCELIQSQGLLQDSNTARRAAIEGMLKAVDPEARLLNAEDAAALRDGPSVEKAEEWPEGICYLRLGDLKGGGGHAVVTQLAAWAEAGRSGVIVDSRGSGGGDLPSVEDLAGLFASSNTPLYRVKPMRGPIGEPRSAAAVAQSFRRPPIMLLTDEATRDACALLARALKGLSGVMLIGSPTRDEPRQREFIALSDGETVYLATGRVVGAGDGGDALAAIDPDIAVDAKAAQKPAGLKDARSDKPPSEKAVEDRRLMEKVAGDAVLARATDILLGLKAIGERNGKATELPLGAEGNAAPAEATNAPAR